MDAFQLIVSQAVTAYSPILLSQAGYSQVTQNGLAGGLNTIGIIGTVISAHIVDRIGRRACLMGGSAALFIVELIVSFFSFPITYTDDKINFQRPELYLKAPSRTLKKRVSSPRLLLQCSSFLIYGKHAGIELSNLHTFDIY